MPERPIRVLLDASAVIAFTDGAAIGVGEIIAEVDEEDGAFGIPVPCLAAAGAEVRDQDLLQLLLAHPACELIDEPDWRRVAWYLKVLDRYDIAAAVALAEELDVQILTRRPGWYVKLYGGGPVIEV